MTCVQGQRYQRGDEASNRGFELKRVDRARITRLKVDATASLATIAAMVGSRLGLVALALAGCAAAAPVRRPALAPPARESRAGARPPRRAGPAFVSSVRPEVALAVETATSLVGRRAVVVDGVDYGDGCAALVRAALDRAGRPLPAFARDAEALHTLAAQRGALRPASHPEPGAVVFLADRPGGAPAHVGLVARASADGTALVVHRAARGVVRLRLNAAAPDRLTDPQTGRRLNDALGAATAAVPAGSLVIDVAQFL